MTRDKIKKVMDACYLAKRARDLLPKLPNGVTPSHIHYLDTIRKLELKKDHIKVSDISDELGLPRPSVTKTIKDMESLGFVEKKAVENDRISHQAVRSIRQNTDRDADIMIKTIEKLYEVMRRRQ